MQLVGVDRVCITRYGNNRATRGSITPSVDRFSILKKKERGEKQKMTEQSV